MRRTAARVRSLTTTAGGRAALRVQAVSGAVSVPGQVSLACRPASGEMLRRTLIPIEFHADGFTCLEPEDTRWLPGDDLDLLGPLGAGFEPPPHQARWLLIAVGVPFEALQPLVYAGLKRQAEIAVWAEEPPPLPPEVEVLSHLEPALPWADFLALAISWDGLRGVQAEPAFAGVRQRARAAQALFLPPMGCGIGVCSVCALEGRRRRVCACTDGPVFPLAELLV